MEENNHNYIYILDFSYPGIYEIELTEEDENLTTNELLKKYDLKEEEIYVNLDDEFMQRIILNLISNAIKFTKKDGTIEVILEDKEENVELIVRDDGVGMEKTFIENAFNRYSMGKNNENASTKGTGIGLFVVKTLVEKQNGTIVIDSVLNEGTTIKMTFKKEEMDYEEY